MSNVQESLFFKIEHCKNLFKIAAAAAAAAQSELSEIESEGFF